MIKKILVFLGVIFLHILLLSQTIFTAWPEMLSYPYLVLNNFALYKDFILPYPPGLIMTLVGFFNLFGFSAENLKYLTWGLIILTDLVLYLILLKITKRIWVSGIFLFLYVFLQTFLDGNMLWFDFATVLPLIASFYFLLKWLENKKNLDLSLVGVFLGLAIAVKQVSLLYLFSVGLFLLIYSWKNIVKNAFLLGIGVMSVAAIVFLFLVFTLSIEFFWKWTIIFPFFEWSKFPGYVDFYITNQWIKVLVLLTLPLLPAVLLVKKIKQERVFLVSLLIFAACLVAIYPRFSFFHLQPAIAFAIIIFAQIYLFIYQKLKALYLISVFVVVIGVIHLTSPIMLGNGIRFFSEKDISLGQEIQRMVKKDERIYLLGLDSSLYVYADRLPPTRWSDNFGWYLEIDGIQDWVLEGIKQTPPKIVLRKPPLLGEWYQIGVYEPKKILNYIYDNYQKESIMENGVEVWTRK